MRQRVTNTLIRLPVSSDLSECSYLDAVGLLTEVNDLPLLLICTQEDSNYIADFLWNNHRITSICVVPKELLKEENSWCIVGHKYTVISEGI